MVLQVGAKRRAVERGGVVIVVVAIAAFLAVVNGDGDRTGIVALDGVLPPGLDVIGVFLLMFLALFQDLLRIRGSNKANPLTGVTRCLFTRGCSESLVTGLWLLGVVEFMALSERDGEDKEDDNGGRPPLDQTRSQSQI